MSNPFKVGQKVRLDPTASRNIDYGIPNPLEYGETYVIKAILSNFIYFYDGNDDYLGNDGWHYSRFKLDDMTLSEEERAVALLNSLGYDINAPEKPVTIEFSRNEAETLERLLSKDETMYGSPYHNLLTKVRDHLK